jgi:hypothetical protein
MMGLACSLVYQQFTQWALVCLRLLKIVEALTVVSKYYFNVLIVIFIFLTIFYFF